MNKKGVKRQYSTDDHDVHTLTKEEYDELNRGKLVKNRGGIGARSIMSGTRKVYMRQSAYAGTGERTW